MRKFSSYGPINTKLHYYAPRTELINKACSRLVGDIPQEGGHYITVWAPRQTGKTWIMQQVLFRLRQDKRFDVIKINLEHLKMQDQTDSIIKSVIRSIAKAVGKKIPDIGKQGSSPEQLQFIFTKEYLKRPLILIIDEFDALAEDAINIIVSVFRNIYILCQEQSDKTNSEKDYLLHGLALIGVRSVLGIENIKGSPFNVQRSLHIPNLTYEETKGIFQWYENESGQKVEKDVVNKIFFETCGQPGLTCWLGELLSEGFYDYEPDKNRPVTIKDFENVYVSAINILPNNNILNIISKAKQEPYKNMVLELFKTNEKTGFAYDDPGTGFLYMNGVIGFEKTGDAENFVRFSCPFVQKRLFNYFAGELFNYTGKLYEPFEDLSDSVTETDLNIKNMMHRFEGYLKKNRQWLLQDAPRRKDLRIYEAVYHFLLYRFIYDFLGTKYAKVWPEFPTGNGKIDILIEYGTRLYGLELKSFTNHREYKEALVQSAMYGKQLNLPEISLVFFVEYIDDKNREKYEKKYQDKDTETIVMPIFIATDS